MTVPQELQQWPDDGTADRLPRLDVRPDLAGGTDPLERILAFLAGLDTDEGSGFLLEAPFDPLPLRRLLGSQGFTAAVRRLDARHWQVLFRRQRAGAAASSAARGRSWREADGLHVDVRGMEAPEPLATVLQALDGAADGEAVVVHHDRDPLLLFPELAERDWTAEYVGGEPGEVRLRLSRASGP